MTASTSANPDLIMKEVDVPDYTLPGALSLTNDRTIASAAEWKQLARPELLEQFEHHAYGKTPRNPVVMIPRDAPDGLSETLPADSITMTVESESRHEILDGKALLRQARLLFRNADRSAHFDVLLVTPLQAKGPVPVFVGLNFWGNHTIHDDPAIKMATPVPGMETKERGSFASRWNLEKLVDDGFAVATAFRGDIAPDNANYYKEQILNLFEADASSPPMGAVGAWAWSLSRILDYLEPIDDVDAKRALVIGHSRMGKASLWAGAQDPRFAAVIANNSGCMGAALSRRKFGETIEIITRNFPYWFSPKLVEYANREDALPFDQHHLLALIAPRPLHIGSAEEDLWADPYGEYLALRAATDVYNLFGYEVNLPATPPAIAQPGGSRVRFHMREGKHDITPLDWAFYQDFAKAELSE